jgi:hypothetical protein
MILMRLVWLQMKVYTPTKEPRSIAAMVLVNAAPARFCNHSESQSTLRLGKGRSIEWTPELLKTLDWYAPLGKQAALSPLVCRAGEESEQDFIRLNKKLVIAVVFISVISTRFLSGSWGLGLVTALLLLNRGRFTQGIGSLSTLSWTWFLVAAWFCGFSHYMRTVSFLSLTLMGLMALALASLDLNFLAFSLLFVLILLGGYVLKRRVAPRWGFSWRRKLVSAHGSSHKTRKTAEGASSARGKEEENTHFSVTESVKTLLGFNESPLRVKTPGGRIDKLGGGSPLSPIRIPFIYWILRKRVWSAHLAFHAVIFLLALAVASYAVSFSFTSQRGASLHGFFDFLNQMDWGLWLDGWFLRLSDSLDRDLSLAILIFIASLVVPSRVDQGRWREIGIILLMGFFLLTGGAFLMDVLDAYHKEIWSRALPVLAFNFSFRASALILFLEPIIITAATVGLWHLFAALSAFIKKLRARRMR